jgi:hypothetical protein
MPDLDKIVEDLCEHIDVIAGDSRSLSQEDSIEIYQRLGEHCSDWAATIRDEMRSS